jgi:hypothetical protein
MDYTAQIPQSLRGDEKNTEKQGRCQGMKQCKGRSTSKPGINAQAEHEETFWIWVQRKMASLCPKPLSFRFWLG